ncbi:MAG: hypothetical protein WCI51_00505 [Lentisphaerota bacterium]|jgi:hypothetical protein
MAEAIARESLCCLAERWRVVQANSGERIGDIACLKLAHKISYLNFIAGNPIRQFDKIVYMKTCTRR